MESKGQAASNSILWAAPDFRIPSHLWERLKSLGWTVVVAHDGDKGLLQRLEETNARACVVQVNGQGDGDLSFLQELGSAYPGVPVVILSRKPDVNQAVEAIKMGALDYLPPSVSEEQLQVVVERAIGLSGEGYRSNRKRTIHRGHSLIVEDPAMKAVVAMAEKVAPRDATVLLAGESGTGKEVLARFIHELSPRCQGPFVAINCAALPEHLLESELFGHEKGAFTGAICKKAGKFELASGGTLLLDEVSEMAPALQAKLLRALQEREIDRVGGRGSIPVDVRVIATTNKDLETETKEGRFRIDLYYRLNVVPLFLPPLRERPEDIIPLARHFLEKQANAYGEAPKVLTEDAETYLLKQPWPGNVRQLENLMERVFLLADASTITRADLEKFSDPVSVQEQVQVMQLMPLKEMEKKMILRALRTSNGNRTHAAKALGISVRTLRNKLNEYRRELGEL